VSRASRKYYRTILLGIAAMAALVWSAVAQFDIAWQEMLQLFMITVAVLLLVILAAAVTVGGWALLKRLLGSRD
jgi:hypothetical protein